MSTYLTSGQVASLFGVDAQTVRRWVNKGYITASRTPGGHMRYDRAEVLKVAAELRGRRG